MTTAQRTSINVAAARLPVGTRTNLESLIGQQAWKMMQPGQRRQLGRQFRKEVTRGQFPLLRYVEKNSANLAQYERV